MKEHPILFSTPLIAPLQEGRKTRSRRLAKQWLKVKAGDHLWVRENLGTLADGSWIYSAGCQPVMVDPENETAMIVWAHHETQNYCPSIHMPKWASRITLIATKDARSEKLQDITEEEARAEGIEAFDFPVPPNPPGQFQRMYGTNGYFPHTEVTAIKAFARLWSTLHTKPRETWDSNPETVVLSFVLAEAK